jgi:hypothetical protein
MLSVIVLIAIMLSIVAPQMLLDRTHLLQGIDAFTMELWIGQIGG